MSLAKAFQLLDDYRLWNSSTRLFLHLFIVVNTSLNNHRDQSFILLCQDVPRISVYAKNWDDFRDCFVLRNSRPLEANFSFSQVPDKLPFPISFQNLPPSNCTIGTQKCYIWVNFKHEPHKYVFSLDSFTP